MFGNCWWLDLEPQSWNSLIGHKYFPWPSLLFSRSSSDRRRTSRHDQEADHRGAELGQAAAGQRRPDGLKSCGHGFESRWMSAELCSCSIYSVVRSQTGPSWRCIATVSFYFLTKPDHGKVRVLVKQLNSFSFWYYLRVVEIMVIVTDSSRGQRLSGARQQSKRWLSILKENFSIYQVMWRLPVFLRNFSMEFFYGINLCDYSYSV